MLARLPALKKGTCPMNATQTRPTSQATPRGYRPTSAEIRAAAAAIRQEWTPEERLHRRQLATIRQIWLLEKKVRYAA